MAKLLTSIASELIIVAIFIIVIVALIYIHKKDKQAWKQNAEDSYLRGKGEAASYIRSTYDQIEENKKKLSNLSDHELLVEIMLALGGYGRRLDRIEDNLDCISNYKKYISDMDVQIHKLSENAVALQNSISNTNTVISRLQNTIQQTDDNIHKLIGALGNLDDLHIRIGCHINDLVNDEVILHQLQKDISSVVTEMNAVLTTYDQAPMKKLKSLETEIKEVSADMQAANEYLSDIKSSIVILSTTTETVKDTIDSSLSEYDHGTLLYRIREIVSKIESLNTDISNGHRTMKDMYQNVDRALDPYHYDSLYRRLEKLSDDLSSIESNVASISLRD